MKKLLLFGALLSLGAVSCRSHCPTYTATKPAPRQATAVTAPPAVLTASVSTSAPAR